MSKESKVMLGILAVVLIIGVAVLIIAGNKSGNNSSGLSKDDVRLIESDSNMTGKAGAKVELVEFGDYQCPACAHYYPIIKTVTDQYKSNPDFNFVFRNFPLSQHQNAMISAEAAEAAGAQGKYWEMHDLLYEKQNDWGESTDPMSFFTQYAQTLGLNLDQFKSDVQNAKFASKINKDQSDGIALGVNATPTLYLNGQQITDISVDNLKQQIDSLLKK